MQDEGKFHTKSARGSIRLTRANKQNPRFLCDPLRPLCEASYSLADTKLREERIKDRIVARQSDYLRDSIQCIAGIDGYEFQRYVLLQRGVGPITGFKRASQAVAMTC